MRGGRVNNKINKSGVRNSSTDSSSGSSSSSATKKKIVLIEELPFLGRQEDHREFVRIMRSIIAKTKYLIVFTLTTDNEREVGGSADTQTVCVCVSLCVNMHVCGCVYV